MSLYVVTGTDTGVGKTFVTVRLIQALRARGVDAIGLKPIETGWCPDSSDAAQLAAASGRDLSETIWGHFDLPAAPSIAARAEARSIEPAEVLGWIRGWAGSLTFVEGAGGWLVPISDDLLFRDLVLQLKPAGVLLVAGTRLGTINHTLLSVESIRASRCPLVAVAISAPEPSPDTIAEIRSFVPEPVFVVPDELDTLAALFHVEH